MSSPTKDPNHFDAPSKYLIVRGFTDGRGPYERETVPGPARPVVQLHGFNPWGLHSFTFPPEYAFEVALAIISAAGHARHAPDAAPIHEQTIIFKESK